MIVQISRIQVRRGLQENLPQLASGEFGWSIDKRRLFIGNGTYDEGAPELGYTELLTEFSDIFSLSEVYTYSGHKAAGYVSQTGPSLVAPSSRSLQDKLDDIANIRDFGGVGDGATNDVDAINRAITQLHKSLVTVHGVHVEEQNRRTLYIPAGRYLLSGDFIRMLPYVRLVGDGKNSTFIIQTDDTQPCTLLSVDSSGRDASQYSTDGTNTRLLGTGTSIFPVGIELENLTLINETNHDVVQFDSVSDSRLVSVRLQGSKASPLPPPPGPPGVPSSANPVRACLNLSEYADPSNPQFVSDRITLVDCDLVGNIYGVYANGSVNNVSISNCLFSQLVNGITLGKWNNGFAEPDGFRITSCTFDNIANEAIWTASDRETVTNIVSAFNVYRNVGTMYSSISAADTYTNVIRFGGNNSYSIGDTFTRNEGASYASNHETLAGTLLPDAVNLLGTASFATLSNSRVQLGKQMTVGGRAATLLATNVLSFAATVGTGNNPTIIEYRITIDANSRIGSLKIIPDGTNVQFADEYIENGSTGVVLTPVINSSGIIELMYTSAFGNATLTTSSRTLI